MKRIISLLLFFVSILSLAACGISKKTAETEITPATTTLNTTFATIIQTTTETTAPTVTSPVAIQSETPSVTTFDTTLPVATTPPQTTLVTENTTVLITEFDPETFDDLVEVDTELAIQMLTERGEALLSLLGDTYEGYCDHIDEVAAFYAETIALSNDFYVLLASRNAACYRWIAQQGKDFSDWNTVTEDCNDAWNDALEDYYDTWDELYSDIYATCDELLNKGQELVGYSTWSDMWGDMYEVYWDAWNEGYEAYWDAWNEIYGIHWDVWTKFLSAKWTIEDIEEILADSDLIGENPIPAVTTESLVATETEVTETLAPPVGTLEELASLVEADVESVISALVTETQILIEDINSYEIYKANRSLVDDFYEKLIFETEQLCILLCEYSVDYAQIILSSGFSSKEMYNQAEAIYDDIYEDAFDEIYDEIYEGIFDDLYDSFYDGVIDDAYDRVPYAEYSAEHSYAYEWYADTHSEIYELYADTHSEIYEFYTDLRGELYKKDMDDAKEVVVDFIDDIEKMKK